MNKEQSIYERENDLRTALAYVSGVLDALALPGLYDATMNGISTNGVQRAIHEAQEAIYAVMPHLAPDWDNETRTRGGTATCPYCGEDVPPDQLRTVRDDDPGAGYHSEETVCPKCDPREAR